MKGYLQFIIINKTKYKYSYIKHYIRQIFYESQTNWYTTLCLFDNARCFVQLVIIHATRLKRKCNGRLMFRVRVVV